MTDLVKSNNTDVLAWIHEDELPESYPYSAMYPHSKVDVVRLFPVFGPQAAPSIGADGEKYSAFQILAITTAYEQGVGKGRQAHKRGEEISNPYSTEFGCDLAWQHGYQEGKEQAAGEVVPQPATADAQDAARYRWLRDKADWDNEGGHGLWLLQISSKTGGFGADDFDRDLDAAMAAQKGGA